MNPSVYFRKVLHFTRHSSFEQAWFFPVWLLLGASRFLILFIPFRRLAPRMGKHTGTHSLIPLLETQQNARAMDVARVIALAARYTLWTSNCFPQAMTAKVMLGLYGIPNSLFFGVMRDNGTLKAHAWIAAGRVKVTGGIGFDQFVVVGCFVSPRALALTGQDK